MYLLYNRSQVNKNNNGYTALLHFFLRILIQKIMPLKITTNDYF